METTNRNRAARRKVSPNAGKETMPGQAPERKPASLKPITAEEQAIAARVAADSSTREWETITEGSALDYSLGRDAFALPPPAKKAQEEKQYAFRWIARTQARIDEMRNKSVPEKWFVCNRVNTPFLDGYFDPVLGGVIREDQILMVKPWWMHARHREMVMRLADGYGDITNKNREKRGSAEFAAGIRTEGAPLRQEIKSGDHLIADFDQLDRETPVEGLSDIAL